MPNPHSKGFTLVEILVAVAIIALLATIGLTTYTSAQITARDTKRKQDIKDIAVGLEVYRQTLRVYPVQTIASTAGGWSTLLSTSFINNMPRDPLNGPDYFYTYNGTATNVTLCARLENVNEPIGINIINGGGDCGGIAGQRYFIFKGP